jgi:hypothetical protein
MRHLDENSTAAQSESEFPLARSKGTPRDARRSPCSATPHLDATKDSTIGKLALGIGNIGNQVDTPAGYLTRVLILSEGVGRSAP